MNAEWNSSLRVRSASLIKLAVMLEVFRQAEQGSLSLTAPIKVSSHCMTGGSGVLKTLEVDRTFSILELVTLMITVSDNSATNKLIDLIGINRINSFCKDIGCCETVIQRRMMDLHSDKDNWTSARDTVTMLKQILRSPFQNEMLSILCSQQFRHKLPALMNPCLAVGSKTGELPGLEHDAAIIVKDEGEPVIAAVLLSDFKNSNDAIMLHRNIGELLSKFMMNNLS
ncbi:serine hydrolase [Fictibacillus aquaticus]|nr:serine hydrolase [Fictibacillus aquaticus]